MPELRKEYEQYMSYRAEAERLFKYNHMYTIAFSINSNQEDGQDISSAQMLEAIINRAQQAHRDGELLEATGAPEDTYTH